MPYNVFDLGSHILLISKDHLKEQVDIGISNMSADCKDKIIGSLNSFFSGLSDEDKDKIIDRGNYLAKNTKEKLKEYVYQFCLLEEESLALSLLEVYTTNKLRVDDVINFYVSAKMVYSFIEVWDTTNCHPRTH